MGRHPAEAPTKRSAFIVKIIKGLEASGKPWSYQMVADAAGCSRQSVMAVFRRWIGGEKADSRKTRRTARAEKIAKIVAEYEARGESWRASDIRRQAPEISEQVIYKCLATLGVKLRNGPIPRRGTRLREAYDLAMKLDATGRKWSIADLTDAGVVDKHFVGGMVKKHLIKRGIKFKHLVDGRKYAQDSQIEKIVRKYRSDRAANTQARS